MGKIKIDINELDKYFKKSELIPAICFEADTKTVLMLAYMNKERLLKLDIHGSGAVQDRSFGIKELQAVIFKRLSASILTAMTIHCL